MPSRDENGKRIPGHAQRLRKAEREAPDPPAAKKVAAKKRAPTKKAPASAENSAEQDLGPNPFDELEPAPIADTSRLITWGAKLHALVLHQIAQDRSAYPNRREWYRALLGGTTSLGVIRDKAMEQQKIDDALHRDEAKGKKQGLSDVRGRKAPQVTRPPS